MARVGDRVPRVGRFFKPSVPRRTVCKSSYRVSCHLLAALVRMPPKLRIYGEGTSSADLQDRLSCIQTNWKLMLAPVDAADENLLLRCSGIAFRYLLAIVKAAAVPEKLVPIPSDRNLIGISGTSAVPCPVALFPHPSRECRRDRGLGGLATGLRVPSAPRPLSPCSRGSSFANASAVPAP